MRKVWQWVFPFGSNSVKQRYSEKSKLSNLHSVDLITVSSFSLLYLLAKGSLRHGNEITVSLYWGSSIVW